MNVKIDLYIKNVGGEKNRPIHEQSIQNIVGIQFLEQQGRIPYL